MTVDVAALRDAIRQIDATMAGEAAELNRIDGQLGDGDLGVTLRNAFQALSSVAHELPEPIGTALLVCAGKVAEVSSSSFGTLMVTAMIGVGQKLGDRTSVPWTEIPELLDTALQRMIARGKASLGDKTVLDAIDASSKAIRAASSPLEAGPAALRAVERAILEFRDRPNRAGRARIFADRSVGLDDPGMVAYRVLVSSVVAKGR